ncbi:calpastatin isoform X2 [Gracilinanus agilis]|uniref:calpastatin isoform X2 n=1 Tax=Gracilinanus agilis TaxID=191870 RepID=UPI001CFC993A|nr:calpastatin isoform X2 [Gracilinanus agilis]
MAFASWWYKTHVYEKSSGTPSKAEEKKKAETSEEKAASRGSKHPSRISTSGTTSSKASTSSPASVSTLSMNPTETKATPINKETKGLHYHDKKKKTPQAKKTETEEKTQTTKATEPPVKDVHGKNSEEDKKQKHPAKQVLATESKDSLAGKETLKPTDQPTPGKPTEDSQNKEKISQPLSGPVKAESTKPSKESSFSDALDDLVDTLGGPEENKPESPKYSGPQVSDPFSSTYIEELGKRESTIPPEYRHLLDSHEGAATGPPDSEKQMGADEAIDSLSSGFTCSTATGKTTDKEKASKGEVLKAPSTKPVKSAAPPEEKKRRIEGKMYPHYSNQGVEDLNILLSDRGLGSLPPPPSKKNVVEPPSSSDPIDSLSETLGHPEEEPLQSIPPSEEVDEAKAREERLKKCGEDEDTLPADYQLKPAMDKDGKPLLPKPEDKSKPISESKLIDELSKDFESSEPQQKKLEPVEKTKNSETPAHAHVKEVVSKTSMCSVQDAPPMLMYPHYSNQGVEDLNILLSDRGLGSLPPPPSKKNVVEKGQVSDDAVEALAGSLGKKEIEPEETKPAVDKIKEKSKEEKREKVGEKEETVPPEYRLKAAKGKDGKLLEKKQSEKTSLMSDDDILDALSEGFSCSKAPVTCAEISTTQKPKDKKRSTEATVMADSTAPPTGSANPPDASQKDEGLDDALDELSKTLGERKSDPDDNKPMEDKVKEKAKAEHRDKLGERDDTIPPDYRHLLDNDKDGKPVKPPPKDPKNSKDGGDPIDELSEGFDNCSQTPSSEGPKKSTKKKDEKDVSSTKPKNGGKSKSKEKSSRSKADGDKTS